ncbi:hypothetical protein GT037_004305 [Alternaria burnsii]|uniref:Uncharacterized protein n=1 Tax=Alternaria burnsii TaxID=1187904 RepID=A0A8H7B5C8_9PLEO|nr:uncharacterized protein GT037_004305 [Alternaria burnsii]KAF7677446.1 hypothetical protein GT037_004305 [Alternaria burnsii]
MICEVLIMVQVSIYRQPGLTLDTDMKIDKKKVLRRSLLQYPGITPYTTFKIEILHLSKQVI